MSQENTDGQIVDKAGGGSPRQEYDVQDFKKGIQGESDGDDTSSDESHGDLFEEELAEAGLDAAGADAALLHLIEEIDNGINTRRRRIETPSGRRWKKFAEFLNILRIPVVFWYIIQTQMEKPAWCLKMSAEKAPANEGGWNPDNCDDANNNFTSWPTAKIGQYYSKTLEALCLLFFLFYNYARNQYRSHDEESLFYWRVQIFITVIAIIDILIMMIIGGYPWVAAFSRPAMLVLHFRVIRQQFRRYLYTLVQSLPMFFFIIVYILYFSWMLQRFFAGTLEGVKYFNSFWNSFWSMFVLMTTANYPDIMLPAYQNNRWTCFFFIIYLILGLFLFMNLLLAIIYSKFKAKIEENLDLDNAERKAYLRRRFDEMAKGPEDDRHLDMVGMYKFLIVIHGLVNNNNQDVFESYEDEAIQYEMDHPEELLAQKNTNNELLGVLGQDEKPTDSKTLKKRDIRPLQFESLYNNKIEEEIENKMKLQFKEMMLLLAAYEFWRYTKENEKAVANIQREMLEKQEEEEKEEEEHRQLGDHHKAKNANLIKKLEKLKKRATPKKLFWDFLKLIRKVLDSPSYELLFNVSTVVMILTILLKQVGAAWTVQAQTTWLLFQIVYNSIATFMFFMELFFLGKKAFSDKFSTWPELLCQILFGIAIYTENKGADGSSAAIRFFELIIFIRLFKLINLMYELKISRIIIETLKNLVYPIFQLITVIMVIYLVFALIGMAMFGGVIRKNLEIFSDNTNNGVYYMDNFNDMFSSFVTLFTLMVVNNWQFQIDMYVAAMGGNTIIRIYFIFFFYFSVVIGINLVIAYVLDMYSSVERLENDKDQTMKLLEYRMKKYEKEQKEQLKKLKEQKNDDE